MRKGIQIWTVSNINDYSKRSFQKEVFKKSPTWLSLVLSFMWCLKTQEQNCFSSIAVSCPRASLWDSARALRGKKTKRSITTCCKLLPRNSTCHFSHFIQKNQTLVLRSRRRINIFLSMSLPLSYTHIHTIRGKITFGMSTRAQLRGFKNQRTSSKF